MNFVLDTNILARAAQPTHPMYREAVDSVDALILRGNTACLLPQVLCEFWAVATRPLSANGLGMSFEEARNELERVRSLFLMRSDNPTIFPVWQKIVMDYRVMGKSGHDARIVAAMKVHSISHVLTFNVQDFARFNDITVISPQQVLSGQPI